MTRQGFTGQDSTDANPASFTAVVNSVADTMLWTSALWTPIPAFDMRAGKEYTVEAGGVISYVTAPTVIFTPRIGSGVVADASLGPSTTTAQPAGSPVNAPWYLRFTLAVRSLGVAAAGATVTGNGFVVIGAGAAVASQVLALGGLVPATVDHTIARALGCSFTWGTASASNTITCQYAVLRSYN